MYKMIKNCLYIYIFGIHFQKEQYFYKKNVSKTQVIANEEQ